MDQTRHTLPEPAAIASRAELPPPPDSRRSALWRAIAGMAVALALAAGIVVIDLSHELIERISHYRSRIASLNRSVNTLKREKDADEKRLADARNEIKERELMAWRDRIRAIMLAPDRKTIKLVATTPQVPLSELLASGTVTISAKMGGGVLNARGLPAPPDGQVYDAWWMLKDAPPAKAAEFRSALDGSANGYLDPPPQGSAPLSLSVTLEASEGGIAPGGPVKLSGKAPPALREEERSGGLKPH
jgi:hypothetical protein